MVSQHKHAENNEHTGNDVDVLIIGAGLSGIGMACHLGKDCPDQRFAIVERRKAMGGTWDLFRYPGIR
ncbi:NAD(P)-binding protein, partial [Alcanivorax sp. HI0044]|uniref:NAD(P)-binding protein n=3 Tax=Alcanivorax TaxID=59753 RepID=UPI000B0CCC4D